MHLARGHSIFRAPVTIGRAGSPIKGIYAGLVTVDPPNIAAKTKAGVAVALPGVAPGDIVTLEPPAALEAGLMVGGCTVTAADQVTIWLTNHTNGAVDGASRAWRYVHVELVF